MARGFEPEMLAFERMAINEGQIAGWNLPTRPTKREGNSHAKDWPDGRPSVELDSLPPSELRALVRYCIEQHADREYLDALRVIEVHERQQLQLFGQKLASH
jgi:hypothetical protein